MKWKKHSIPCSNGWTRAKSMLNDLRSRSAEAHFCVESALERLLVSAAGDRVGERARRSTVQLMFVYHGNGDGGAVSQTTSNTRARLRQWSARKESECRE